MNGDVTPPIIKTSKGSTFSCIRTTVLDDFEAVSRDNEILRTFLANHHSGEDYIYLFFNRNDIWHRIIPTPLTRRNDFGDIHTYICHG
jgi:hypothetical protein